MPGGCGCAGQSCGCSIVNGAGISVTGVGSASNPFIVSIDNAAFSIGSQVKVGDTTTIDMSITGDGTPLDPLLIQARVLLTSPAGSRFTLDVSDSGVLSTRAV